MLCRHSRPLQTDWFYVHKCSVLCAVQSGELCAGCRVDRAVVAGARCRLGVCLPSHLCPAPAAQLSDCRLAGGRRGRCCADSALPHHLPARHHRGRGGLTCPSDQPRTVDGSCNNLETPDQVAAALPRPARHLSQGAAGTPFLRLLDAEYSSPDRQFRLGVGGTALPPAREVSRLLARDRATHPTTGQFSAHLVQVNFYL